MPLLSDDYAVFHIHISTTGFNGLYIDNKHHQIIEIASICQNNNLEFSTYVYPDDQDMDAIHPLSVRLHKIPSFSYIKTKLKGSARSTAVKDLHSFIENNKNGKPVLLLAYKAKYVKDCLHELPEQYSWIDIRAAFKSCYPEMEQFRWELISINKDLIRLQDQQMASMGSPAFIQVQEINTDTTPYRLNNIMRYFYRDKPSYAFKTTASSKQCVKDIQKVTMDHLIEKLNPGFFLPRVTTSTERLLKRLSDIGCLNKKQITVLADCINADYLGSGGMEVKHSVNPNIITIGDLLLYVGFLISNERVDFEMIETNEWKRIFIVVEHVLRTLIVAHSDETILTILEFISGVDVPTLIANGYPFSGGTPSAFHPFKFTLPMTRVLKEHFAIDSITKLRTEYTLHSENEDEKRRFMNRIRINLYGIEAPSIVDEAWNPNRAEEIFQAL